MSLDDGRVFGMVTTHNLILLLLGGGGGVGRRREDTEVLPKDKTVCTFSIYNTFSDLLFTLLISLSSINIKT